MSDSSIVSAASTTNRRERLRENDAISDGVGVSAIVSTTGLGLKQESAPLLSDL